MLPVDDPELLLPDGGWLTVPAGGVGSAMPLVEAVAVSVAGATKDES